MAPLRLAKGRRLGWVAALASLGCGARSELLAPLGDARVDAATDVFRDAFGDPRDEPLPVVDTPVTEIAAENAGPRRGMSVSIRASTVLTLDDGTALGWGEGRWYELGPPNDRVRVTPEPIAGVRDMAHVAVGSFVACGLGRDTSVRCWGIARYAGVPGPDFQPSTTAPPLLSGVAQVSAGFTHTCALMLDGTARCWGANARGALGDGTQRIDRVQPVAVSGLTDIAQISAGTDSTCALRRDASVWCWGENTDGQLGDGTMEHRQLPVRVDGLPPAAGVSTAAGTTCAWLTDGRVMCWGLTGAHVGRRTTRPVTIDGIDQVVQVSVFGPTACAVRADGTVWCWGDNSTGTLGDGTTRSRFAPAVTRPMPAVLRVTLAHGVACALTSEGRTYCWGSQASHLVGVSASTAVLEPARVW